MKKNYSIKYITSQNNVATMLTCIQLTQTRQASIRKSSAPAKFMTVSISITITCDVMLIHS